MTFLIASFLVTVWATLALTAQARVQRLQTVRGMPGTYGMRPCKRCGGSKLHSQDELLATDDGELAKMKEDLSKEVEGLEDEVEELKKKHGDELGKLKKQLSKMDSAYKKLGEDTIARTAKFATVKAKAAKDLSVSLDNTEKSHALITKLQASMRDMQKAVAPYVDKFISGKDWPKGCKCPKAKALLQRLQATLQVVNLDTDGADEEPVALGRRGEALLRRSAKTSKPADQEKYKLAREVQQLEEKRAKLNEEKMNAISSYSEQQRITLDRIDVAKTRSNLKTSTELKYKDSDQSLEKTLDNQKKAADSYLESAKTKLARLEKGEAAALKDFKEFKAELQKCKCL